VLAITLKTTNKIKYTTSTDKKSKILAQG